MWKHLSMFIINFKIVSVFLKLSKLLQNVDRNRRNLNMYGYGDGVVVVVVNICSYKQQMLQ